MCSLDLLTSGILSTPASVARYTLPTETASAETMVVVQPSSLIAGSSLIQKVESIINTKTSIHAYGEEVCAPAVTTDLGAAGAALTASRACGDFGALFRDAFVRKCSISPIPWRSTTVLFAIRIRNER